MDRTDLTFDATPNHTLYPELPSTPAAEVLAALRQYTRSAPNQSPR